MANYDQKMLRAIIEDVLKGLMNNDSTGTTPQVAASEADGIALTPLGEATVGTAADEVVIGISAAFADAQTKNILGVPHADIMKAMMAGIEEEGLRTRVVKVFRSGDVAVVGHDCAELSGSGVAIGIQSRGTALIHQKDLPQLSNLELFSQCPLIDLETYRAIGKNAAKYAKGESPAPVPVKNDQMARPAYQARAALLYLKEVEHVVPGAKPVEMKVTFK